MTVGVFTGAGGTLGVDTEAQYTPAQQTRVGWREGETIIGVDGYPYLYRIATADITAGTAGAPSGGVTSGNGYWSRGTSLGTGSNATYATTYPALDPKYFNPSSVS